MKASALSAKSPKARGRKSQRSQRRSQGAGGTRDAARAVRKTSPRERWLIAVILLVGCGLRLAFLSNAAVEHFDEGVYASNLLFDASQGFAYPNRHLYAPPLVPAAIEWTQTFLGLGGAVPILPSVLLGCGTIFLVWCVARDWFGPQVALICATLASFSDLHIVYSRTALTDVPVTFLMLLSVWLGWRALRGDSWRTLVFCGGACGLGWWCKYNGWLPLAIIGSGSLAWLLFERTERRRTTRVLLKWLTIAAVAVLVWSPVLVGLQSSGGYSEVSRNHSNYVVGFAGWWDSLTRQLENISWFESPLTQIGFGLALVLGLSLVSGAFLSGANGRSKAASPETAADEEGLPGASFGNWLSYGLMTLGAGLALTWGPSLVVLAGLSVTGLICRYLRSESPEERLGLWLLAAWLGGLSLATPFYHAYPRLTLPWHVAAWLASGLAIHQFAQWNDGHSGQAKRAGPTLVFLVVLISLLSLEFLAMKSLQRAVRHPQVTAWASRRGLEEASARLTAATRAAAGEKEFVILVYGDPALFFHLRVAGTPALPVAEIPSAEALSSQLAVFFVSGTRAEQDPQFVADRKANAERMHHLTDISWQPSRLVLSNDYDLRRLSYDRSADLRLYRMQR